jgi:FkbM family methyltransferase
MVNTVTSMDRAAGLGDVGQPGRAEMAPLHRKSLLTTILDQALIRVVRLLSARRRRLGQPRMFIAPDDYIGETILAEGCFEKGYLASMARLFAAAEAAGLPVRTGIALDIGANIGNHSLFLARHLRHVHSFEPSPMIAQILRANRLINPDLSDRITVHEVALSDADEVLPYVTQTRNLGGSGFRRDGQEEADGVAAAPLTLVHAGRYLTSVLDPDDRIACVKVDVEGMEDKVISGLQNLLRRDRPLVFMEVGDGALGERLRELLRDCGYGDIYEIHNSLNWGEQSLPQRLATAVLEQVTYRLRPVGRFDERLYPMVVAAPDSVVEILHAEGAG